MARITTVEQLTSMYRAPAERVRTKKRDRLDDGLGAVLAASPFVLLGTADANGRCDVSPRGGPPGFVKALDDRHVALPDLNGNNLVDSLRNIVANPHAGLLVIVPGQDETLRIDGPAYLSTDDDVLDRFTTELRRPTLAIVIETAAVFTHCAKSFRRGHVWEPESWADGALALEARYRQLGLTESFDEYACDNAVKIADGLAADVPG
jgi:PPOX class probable FMN-dependent enzyme